MRLRNGSRGTLKQKKLIQFVRVPIKKNGEEHLSPPLIIIYSQYSFKVKIKFFIYNLI